MMKNRWLSVIFFCSVFLILIEPCESFIGRPFYKQRLRPRWRTRWMPDRKSNRALFHLFHRMRQDDEIAEIKTVKSYKNLTPVSEDNTNFGPNVCSYEVDPVPRIMNSWFGERVRGTRFYNGQSKVRLCCPGFATEDGKRGCPKELYTSSESLLEVAKTYGLRSLVRAVTEAGLGATLLDKGPITLFAPTNEAFKKYEQTKIFRTNVETREALKDLLLSHIVPGKVVSEELYRGKQLKSITGKIFTIRESCDRKVKNIEGSNILEDNNLGASNGIIHVIDRVITSPSESLKDFLEQRTQFQRFKKYLEESEIKINSPVTVFLFADKSIEETDSEFLQQPCKGSKAMIQHHIVKGRYYLADLSPGAKLHSLLDERLTIHFENSTAKVDEAEVLFSDIPIKDGIIHILKKAVVPLKARDVVNAASRFDYNSQFIKILGIVDGAKETLRKGNWTVFIPTNDAFTNLPNDVAKKIEDVKVLSKILFYHLVPGVVLPRDIKNDNILKTHESSALRVNKYRRGSILSVNGVQLYKYSDVCNGVIYFIDQVLVPPQTTLLEYLRGNQNFSTLLALLENSGLSASININSPLTLFAPTNQALANLKLSDEALKNPPEEVVNTLKYHAIPSTVYSSALSTPKCYSYYKSFYRSRTIPSLESSLLRLTSSGFGTTTETFRVNDVSVVKRDIMASDGVVHVIDDVLKIPGRRSQIINEVFSSL